MTCWSPEQVKACRIRSIIAEYDNDHLPWCTFKVPYLESDCNCHSPNRETYLLHYAESVIAGQDKIAEILKRK